MPFVLFAALVLATIPVGGLIVAASLYITGLLFRARALNLRRSAAAGAILIALQVPLTIALMEFGPPTARLEGIAGIAFLIVYIAVVRFAARTRIPRTLAIAAVSLVCIVAASLAERAVLNATLLETFRVPTAGMAPTLTTGDRFVADYTLTPRRWDIVTFRTPEDPGQIWGQRLIGLPGETVEVKDGKVHINGEPIDPPRGIPAIPYLSRPPRGQYHPGPLNGCEGNPITLRPGECFVLGDNTEASFDSRYWSTPARPGMQPGALPLGDITGVARCIYAPASRLKVFR